MQVILLERIEKLGQMGDVVKVKPGYARNFLLPKKKAMRATDENLKVFESQRAQLEADNLERRSEAESVAGKLDGLSIVLIRQAGEGGQLYGSVTARDMAQALDGEGVKVDRSQVQLDDHAAESVAGESRPHQRDVALPVTERDQSRHHQQYGRRCE